MKITVEVDRYVLGTEDYPAIRIIAKVDGEEDLGLSHVLKDEEMRSNFDVIWEFLGDKLKRAHAERKKQEVPVEN